MEWQPQDEPLRLLAGYLRDALNSYDRNLQKNAEMVRIMDCFVGRVLSSKVKTNSDLKAVLE